MCGQHFKLASFNVKRLYPMYSSIIPLLQEPAVKRGCHWPPCDFKPLLLLPVLMMLTMTALQAVKCIGKDMWSLYKTEGRWAFLIIVDR